MVHLIRRLLSTHEPEASLLGADKGAGGKYLILPPGYTDKAPDGYIALQSDTFP